MNFIDVDSLNFINAKEKHYDFFRFIIESKLKGSENATKPILFDGFEGTVKKYNEIDNSENRVLKEFLLDESNVKKVLIGNPEELNEVKNKFPIKDENDQEIVDTKKALKAIFNYSYWLKSTTLAYSFYRPIDLAESLDCPTCTYCNRLYTKTVRKVDKSPVTRPVFDHWFPKSKYPILALSFYNLIPSCKVCNSDIKGNRNVELGIDFHPYFKGENDLEFNFSYVYESSESYSLKIRHHNRFSENFTDSFKIKEVYGAHLDELRDLIQIKKAYSQEYINNLQKIVGKEVNLNRKDIYRLAFGVHYEDAKIGRRPLSKFKKDILIELGIVD